MHSPRDPRPTPALPSFDPAQLSFGDVEAVPQLRVDREAEGTSAAADSAMAAFREPPVCGESSYDDVEDAGPSWSVRIVQEAEATPAVLRARAAATQRSSGQSATSEAARPSGARPAPAARGAASHLPSEPALSPRRPAPVAVPTAALDPLKRSTEMSPRDADAAIAYANALEKHGDASAALEALDVCLAAGGDQMHLICARAFLLGSRLKYDLAEAELKRAAKLRADDPELQLQVGILACRRARWRDAVEPLQKAAVQRAEDALAHFYLGEALNHVDQLAPALRAYEQATRLDPANWRAFKGVGIVLDRLGRPTDAAVAYRHMREAQGR
ncbi:MAG: tetratricopeptide repeat protein [Gemmatimonadaceae bacterium]|nr:tetratricopeptide repeat protein [Gemmatimonadaceae bacterium]